MAALQRREIPSGHGRATAICITQVTTLTRSQCILQLADCWGVYVGDRKREVTALIRCPLTQVPMYVLVI